MRINLKKLGPGLLFAGAAIGVSHLVQSTRAGADFGFGLIWALLMVTFLNILSFNLHLVMLVPQERVFWMATKNWAKAF